MANVVAKGRVREKDKENVVKGHEVKSGQRRIRSKFWSMAKMWSIAKMWSMELMVGGKDAVDGKIRSKKYGQRWLSNATLPEATTDCCVANTIVNCYYWSFEVADAVVNGRFKIRTMIMWL